MTSIRHGPRKSCVPAVLDLATGLAACSASEGDAGRVGWVASEDRRIAVEAAAFGGAEAVGVRYASMFQVEEYALFEAGGRQAELIYAAANKRRNMALQYDYSISAMVPTWRYNAGRVSSWGELGRLDAGSRTWFYRPYTLEGSRRPCFGFHLLREIALDDPQRRPREMVFGYYCGAEDETLSDDQTRSLIQSIGIRGRPPFERPGSRADRVVTASVDGAPAGRGPLTVARGAAPLGAGNPEFPFKFARYYSSSSGKKP